MSKIPPNVKGFSGVSPSGYYGYKLSTRLIESAMFTSKYLPGFMGPTTVICLFVGVFLPSFLSFSVFFFVLFCLFVCVYVYLFVCLYVCLLFVCLFVFEWLHWFHMNKKNLSIWRQGFKKKGVEKKTAFENFEKQKISCN